MGKSPKKDKDQNWPILRSSDWHADIAEEMDARDNFCRIKRGPNYIYKRPKENPHLLSGLDEFLQKYPFRKKYALWNADKRAEARDKAQCVFLPPDYIPRSDVNKRFYPDINNKDLCNQKRGFWSPATNRNYRYGRGVCWKRKDDAHCAKYEEVDLLRPGASPEKKAAAAARGSQLCNYDPQCKWVKMRTSQDCFSKAALSSKRQAIAEKPPSDMPDDITTGDIEQYLYDWYVEGTKGPAPATSQLIGEGNRCKSRVNTKAEQKEIVIENEDEPLEENGAPPMLPTMSQSIINMVLKNIDAKGSTNRGILAVHSVGSGKTCTAAGVMEAFWDSPRDIIFATSLDALAANPPINFMKCLYNMYPRFQRAPYKQPTMEASLRLIETAFEHRRIRFLSFAKLANRVEKSAKAGGGKEKSKGVVVIKPKGKLSSKSTTSKSTTSKSTTSKSTPVKSTTTTSTSKTTISSKSSNSVTSKASPPIKKLSADEYIDLNNSILIIDEVHNLFRPLPTQRKQHDYLKSQLIDPTKYPGLKVVILTATPGDNVEDVIHLLNIVRDPTKPAIKPPNIDDAEGMQRFRDSIRGTVSFFDLSGDKTRFPIVKDNTPRLFPMSDTQFKKYVEAYKKTVSEKKATNYDKLAKDNQLNKYWAPARKYSNMLYTWGKEVNKMEEFSAKMPGLLETISAYPNEKHYVYSSFYDNREKGWGSHGILTIAKFLEQELGYTKLTVKEANALAKAGAVPATKAKRYVLVTQNEIGDKGEESGKLSKSAGLNLKDIMEVYNHPENRYGEYVNVMLASQGFNEGLDLKAVRHIHMFEPLLTMASDKQTIGRAARFCSHGDLDITKGEWTVQIHRYMSDLPLGVNALVAGPSVVPQLGATEVEKDHLRRLNADVMEAQSVIEDLQSFKHAKDSVEATRIAQLKVLIKEKKKQIKLIADSVEDRDKAIRRNTRKQKSKSMDATGVENIDKFIYNEARNRFKEILAIYESMKETAIDCQVLKKFHGSTGRTIQCAYENENKNKNPSSNKPVSRYPASPYSNQDPLS